ncbi:hypothetical protein JI435_409150 [Parastagonospora nodorum SN15]|uniref:Uncharacterized protein n=1 Tax=Phaeosphaeria nodorum (strain SN15 / ATCC MYA-4574 / FGSC 10173) TaxID=321614 RepID=A0A7U2F0L0_PHANO|nr:hypothetical protein JI435_409150 [Parastagonospora nodorum SN15]
MQDPAQILEHSHLFLFICSHYQFVQLDIIGRSEFQVAIFFIVMTNY